MSVLVGPDGDIVDMQWKARNILGLFGDQALIGTTVYDVLDRYVEMYGWDRTLPVARTDIGNICMTAVGAEPTLYTCLGLKGAEILVLSVTGGSNAESAITTARANRLYTVGVGNSVSPDNIGFPEASGTEDGGTVIVDPRGTKALLLPVLQAYDPVFQPNAFAGALPATYKEAGELVRKRMGMK
jgi:hypothetical protein